MTTLVLSVVRGPAGSVSGETRPVSSGEFVIGRAPPSDWVLEDPRCVVSKRHCVFRQDERGWSVADVSRNGSVLATASGTIRLGRQPQPVVAGSHLRFGDYELAIGFEEEEKSFRLVPRDPGGARRARPGPPPEVPPLERPAAMPMPRQTSAQRPRIAEDETPTQLSLEQAAAPVRSLYGLAALLEGASLAPDDVVAPGREAEVLRAAGAALRATISEVRRFRLATLGEPNELPPAGYGAESRPLAEARSERDALRWLLGGDRRYDVPPDAVIESAFAEFRQHHDCLVRAARQSARSLIEGLDPDEPERTLLPRWFDVIPGWRRARAAAVARRRFRRLRANLDRVIDQALARAYLEIRRDVDQRWRPR